MLSRSDAIDNPAQEEWDEEKQPDGFTLAGAAPKASAAANGDAGAGAATARLHASRVLGLCQGPVLSACRALAAMKGACTSLRVGLPYPTLPQAYFNCMLQDMHMAPAIVMLEFGHGQGESKSVHDVQQERHRHVTGQRQCATGHSGAHTAEDEDDDLEVVEEPRAAAGAKRKRAEGEQEADEDRGAAMRRRKGKGPAEAGGEGAAVLLD